MDVENAEEASPLEWDQLAGFVDLLRLKRCTTLGYRIDGEFFGPSLMGNDDDGLRVALRVPPGASIKQPVLSTGEVLHEMVVVENPDAEHVALIACPFCEDEYQQDGAPGVTYGRMAGEYTAESGRYHCSRCGFSCDARALMARVGITAADINDHLYGVILRDRSERRNICQRLHALKVGRKYYYPCVCDSCHGGHTVRGSLDPRTALYECKRCDTCCRWHTGHARQLHIHAFPLEAPALSLALDVTWNDWLGAWLQLEAGAGSD